MFINKTEKKENKILKFFAIMSCLLNVLFVLNSKFGVLFESRIYEVSYVDVLLVNLKSFITLFTFLSRVFLCLTVVK